MCIIHLIFLMVAVLSHAGYYERRKNERLGLGAGFGRSDAVNWEIELCATHRWSRLGDADVKTNCGTCMRRSMRRVQNMRLACN